ncbi:MAG: methyltransferase domain-containing protein [Vicinamibacterales bacterium]
MADPLRDVEQALWTLLTSAAADVDRRGLVARLVSSPELHHLRRAWAVESPLAPLSDPQSPSRVPDDDVAFVRLAYETFLRRPADEGGLAHYVKALASGEARAAVVRSLVLSDEFGERFRDVPRDTQLCELANPAKWDNDEWLAILRSLGLSDDKLVMHRKPYEFAQLIYGCRRLGALHERSTVISVGAGHEHVLYWLANHVRLVLATDMYEGVWQSSHAREGDPEVLKRPEAFAPFPYRRDHLIFMQMDGRRLAFRDESVDIAYSLSSIEHFGGLEGADQTMREMARVLKPGGLLALATEYVVSGPVREETFQPREFMTLIDQPDLELVEPIDVSVFNRYRYSPVDLERNPLQAPHMLVRLGDTVFTSVMVFLRKRAARPPAPEPDPRTLID